jgi:hypothetical protein
MLEKVLQENLILEITLHQLGPMGVGRVTIGVSTVTLTSPNGTRYRLNVDNAGNLSTVLVNYIP